MPRTQDLAVLREILQRELETINAYESMLDRIEDPALRQIIEHVTDEEREHVAEMYQLIMERDPRQQERARRSEEQLGSMGLGRAPAASGSAAAAASVATSVATSVAAPVPASSAAPVSSEPTAAAAAGLSEPLLLPPGADPTPPPPPIFPDGSWSVGTLRRSRASRPVPEPADAAGSTADGDGAAA